MIISTKPTKPKDKTTHNDLIEAEMMLDKWASPPMRRNVYSKKAEMSHRTALEVTKLTVFP